MEKIEKMEGGQSLTSLICAVLQLALYLSVEIVQQVHCGYIASEDMAMQCKMFVAVIYSVEQSLKKNLSKSIFTSEREDHKWVSQLKYFKFNSITCIV